MERELLILRHGKSDWDAGADDYQRPLKGSGVKTAMRVGNWLKREGLVPVDLTISSTATSAMFIAVLVFNGLSDGVKDIQ